MTDRCPYLEYRTAGDGHSFDGERAYCTVVDRFVQPMRADICNARHGLSPRAHCEFYREHEGVPATETAPAVADGGRAGFGGPGSSSGVDDSDSSCRADGSDSSCGPDGSDSSNGPTTDDVPEVGPGVHDGTATNDGPGEGPDDPDGDG